MGIFSSLLDLEDQAILIARAVRFMRLKNPKSIVYLKAECPKKDLYVEFVVDCGIKY